MPELTYSDELVELVAAANLAGYMEAAGRITVPSDEHLTEFLLRKHGDFAKLSRETDDCTNFYAYMGAALSLEYGSEEDAYGAEDT